MAGAIAWLAPAVAYQAADLAQTFPHFVANSLRPVDPTKPDSQQYGFGITEMRWRRNTMYFHGGEMPGYNSFIGSDPANGVTLVVWTNLTVSVDETPTANALMLKVLDQIYAVSPLRRTPRQAPLLASASMRNGSRPACAMPMTSKKPTQVAKNAYGHLPKEP
jgi:hypothetical protein